MAEVLKNTKEAEIKKRVSRAIRRNPSAAAVFSSNFWGPIPPRLYHYTTQHGMLGIVPSKSFWATDLRYLNDFEEYVYAIDCAEKAIASIAPTIKVAGADQLSSMILALLKANRAEDYFIFSLSEDGDSLNQWRSYTRQGPGYALGFDSIKLHEYCLERGYTFGRCLYSRREAESAISQLAAEYMVELAQYFPLFSAGEINEDLIFSKCRQFLALFLKYAAFIKNPAFEQECEWRIIAAVNAEDKGLLEFRSGPHSIVPYIAIQFEETEFLKKILRDIVIKPSPHMDLAEQAIKEFVQSQLINAKIPDYEIKDYSIKRSGVPYREGN